MKIYKLLNFTDRKKKKLIDAIKNDKVLIPSVSIKILDKNKSA